MPNSAHSQLDPAGDSPMLDWTCLGAQSVSGGLGGGGLGAPDARGWCRETRCSPSREGVAPGVGASDQVREEERGGRVRGRKERGERASEAKRERGEARAPFPLPPPTSLPTWLAAPSPPPPRPAQSGYSEPLVTGPASASTCSEPGARPRDSGPLLSSVPRPMTARCGRRGACAPPAASPRKQPPSRPSPLRKRHTHHELAEKTRPRTGHSTWKHAAAG